MVLAPNYQNHPTTNTTPLSSPLIFGSSFTVEQSDQNKDLVNPEIYPHLYGDKLFAPLKCIERCVIVNIKDIDTPKVGTVDVNQAWSKDGNPKYAEIKTSIENFGFRLVHPPIALFRNKSGALVKINGRSRNEILTEWEYSNRICDIYEGDWENYNQSQIEDAISKFGQSSNLQGYDPHGTTSAEDLVQNCLHAIEKGWIHKDNNGVPLETGENSVTSRLDDICGDYKLTAKPKELLVARIVAQTDEVLTGKRFWPSPAHVERFIVSGQGGMNFINIKPQYDFVSKKCTSRGIMYVVFETSEVRRSLPTATALAASNPDSDVRVILYKQYIKAYDAPTNFMDTLSSVKNYWDSQLSKYSTVHFNGAKILKGNCYIYGAVPSLRSLHNLNYLIFLQSDDEWKQK